MPTRRIVADSSNCTWIRRHDKQKSPSGNHDVCSGSYSLFCLDGLERRPFGMGTHYGNGHQHPALSFDLVLARDQTADATPALSSPLDGVLLGGCAAQQSHQDQKKENERHISDFARFWRRLSRNWRSHVRCTGSRWQPGACFEVQESSSGQNAIIKLRAG